MDVINTSEGLKERQCKKCGKKCRLYIMDGDKQEYYCFRHNPESIKKRSSNQKKYYHTEKGGEAYHRVYLKKLETKQDLPLKS